MDKRALKSYLKSKQFVELTPDKFLAEKRKFDTFCVYKDSILINAGYKLFFDFNFSKKKSICDYSAICISGYELETKDNGYLFGELNLFCDCKKSENDFLDELKSIL